MGHANIDSNCIFANFHKRCKFFENNECTNSNCSYYHDPKLNKKFLINPELIKILKDQFLNEFEEKLQIAGKKIEVEKNERNCAICLVKKADHIVLPCGHVNYCF